MVRPTDEKTRTLRPLVGTRDSPLARSAERTPLRDGSEAETEEVSHESLRALFNSQQRGGRWEPAEEIEANAYFGEVVLDFTRAVLPESGEIGIEAFTVCGEIRIIVPPHAEIDVQGEPMLGSIEHEAKKKPVGERIREWVTGREEGDPPLQQDSEEPPYFRIDARPILGTIKILTGR